MKTFICGLSALEFWQQLRCREQPDLNMVHPVARDSSTLGLRQARATTPGPSLPNDSELRDACRKMPYMLTAPIDLLSTTKRSHGSTSMRTRHVWSGPLPRGSFVQISPGMHVASPEFLFLQLAQRISPQRLTLLGYELCGSYCMPVRGHHGTDGSTCLQATSVTRLSEYLARHELDGCHGINVARQVASNVVGFSNSPRESAMVMLLCLPKKLGGYGLPRPRMNAVVYIPQHLRAIAGRAWFSIDALWRDRRFGVEYDGGVGHRGESNIARDYSRANALLALGYNVETISNAQISDERSFDLFAHQVARSLGVRLRFEGSREAWRSKNRALRGEVLSAHRWGN
ncbi:MAG: hypothetical protein SOI24_08170 [Coriobacteriales bacterium]